MQLCINLVLLKAAKCNWILDLELIRDGVDFDEIINNIKNVWLIK